MQDQGLFGPSVVNRTSGRQKSLATLSITKNLFRQQEDGTNHSRLYQWSFWQPGERWRRRFAHRSFGESQRRMEEAKELHQLFHLWRRHARSSNTSNFLQAIPKIGGIERQRREAAEFIQGRRWSDSGIQQHRSPNWKQRTTLLQKQRS